MKVSVITVAYNSAATIGDTLRSVTEQQYADIEHIVIDGDSTDGTQAVVAREGRRTSHMLSEPDGGIYDAMNKGMALASGELVGFLNADDVFNGSDAVGAIVAAARLARDSEVLYGDLVYARAADLDAVVRNWKAGVFRRTRLRLGWMPPHPTFYVRRSLLEQIGPFNTTLRIAADYDFMLRCLLHVPETSVVYVPQVLVRMRAGGVSNGSVTTVLRKSREDLMVMRRNRVGGIFCLAAKNVRKIPQFFG